MPRRFLDPRIGTDATLAALAIDHKGTGLLAALLFVYGLPHATEDGLLYYPEAPDDLLAMCASRLYDQEDYRPRLRKALALLVSAGLLIWHEDAHCFAYKADSWYRYQTKAGEGRRRTDSDPVPDYDHRPRRGRPRRAVTPPDRADQAQTEGVRTGQAGENNSRSNFNNSSANFSPNGAGQFSTVPNGHIVPNSANIVLNSAIFPTPESPTTAGDSGAPRAGARARGRESLSIESGSRETNTESISPPPTPPVGFRLEPTHDPAGFGLVEATHPRPGNRNASVRWWNQHRPDDATVRAMVTDITWRLEHPTEPDGWDPAYVRFVPALPRYFEDARWTTPRAAAPPEGGLPHGESPRSRRPANGRRLEPASDDELADLADGLARHQPAPT